MDTTIKEAAAKIMAMFKSDFYQSLNDEKLEEKIADYLLELKQIHLNDFFDVKHRNTSMRHSCKRSGCMVLNAPDFQKMLEGVFPNRMRPGDVDCVVEVRVTDHRNAVMERKSHFLTLESKHIKDTKEPLNMGQRLTLEARAKGGDTVILIYHDRPDGSDIVGVRVWNLPSYVDGRLIRSNLDKFRKMCALWFSLVEGTYSENVAA